MNIAKGPIKPDFTHSILSMYPEIKEYFLPDYLSIFRLLYLMKNIKKKIRIANTLTWFKKKKKKAYV